MADEDEDLVVTLDDDEETQPPQVNGAQAAKPPPVPGPGARSPAPDTGLKDLQTQLQNERAQRAREQEQARRLAAERDQAIAFARQAEARGLSTFELQNETELNAANDQMEALSDQAEAAMNDGDFKTAAECNKKMHRLGGRIALLERDKANLANQRETMKVQHARPTTQQPRQPTEPQPTDPLERSLQGRTEPTKQFLRKHPELIRGDGSLKRAAIDAHETALDAGFQVDTQGYFDHIEKLLGGSGQPAGGEVRVPSGRAPTIAAPASRGGGGAAGGGIPETFTMTPKMRRLAEEQGVTPKEWAKNYVRLLAEGRITPIT